MAVKTKKDKTVREEIRMVEKSEAKNETCVCRSGKWVTAGWVALLFGGLAHMLPEQMAPIIKWSQFGISLQMAIGVLSVILALNFLLEE